MKLSEIIENPTDREKLLIKALYESMGQHACITIWGTDLVIDPYGPESEPYRVMDLEDLATNFGCLLDAIKFAVPG
jgi:hypothetical protein